MVKVEMPRASWEMVIAILLVTDYANVEPLIKEISSQVYSQEY